MIRVLLADDHGIVRDGLRALLEAHADISVVGLASNGHEALNQARLMQPDVVVMDIAMPELNGIDAAAQVVDVSPDTRVIILSMYSSNEDIFRALQVGALGYVLKESAGKEVVEAVRAVHAGRRYLSQKLMETVIDDYIHQRGLENPLASLSIREREVLQLVVEGKTSVEIAETLALSSKTVDTYRSRLMEKLGLENLPSLVKFAIRHHLSSL